MRVHSEPQDLDRVRTVILPLDVRGDQRVAVVLGTSSGTGLRLYLTDDELRGLVSDLVAVVDRLDEQDALDHASGRDWVPGF